MAKTRKKAGAWTEQMEKSAEDAALRMPSAAVEASDGQTNAPTPKKAKKVKTKALQASDGQVIAAAPEPKDEPAPAVVVEAAKLAKPQKVARASPTTDIRLMLAANPSIKPADIKEALAKKGVHPPISTISTVRADFLGCLRALEAAGRLTSN